MPFYDLALPELRAYEASHACPEDFDAFWSSTLAEARGFDLAASFEPVDVGLVLFDVFDVTFSGYGGHPIKGWFIRPKGAQGPLPCIVKYIGYGGGRGFAHQHLLWPAAGHALFVMDTRGQGSSWGNGDTPDPVGSEPAHPGFMSRGIQDPATYYYRRLYVDAVRAIEVARSHPSVDSDRIILTGISQGGGVAIAAGGLVPDVLAVMPDVPFLCDFPRSVTIAQRDPFPEIARYLSIHRDKTEKVFRTLSYFDGVFFAQRSKAIAFYSVAIMDTICPPSTVYAAFNAHAGSAKEIMEYQFNDHEGGGGFQEQAQLDWLARRI